MQKTQNLKDMHQSTEDLSVGDACLHKTHHHHFRPSGEQAEPPRRADEKLTDLGYLYFH